MSVRLCIIIKRRFKGHTHVYKNVILTYVVEIIDLKHTCECNRIKYR